MNSPVEYGLPRSPNKAIEAVHLEQVDNYGVLRPTQAITAVEW